jgi:hypothetical protein
MQEHVMTLNDAAPLSWTRSAAVSADQPEEVVRDG